MKKKNIISLIRCYAEKNDDGFRNEAYEIARDFDVSGDHQLAEYIMSLLSNVNTFVPQMEGHESTFFERIEAKEDIHYINLFLEKYGYGVEVPVLELLDPDRGLGAPSYYLQDANRSVAPRQSKNLNEERLEKVIHRKFAQALKMKQKTIEIDDQDIQYIAGDQKQENILISM